MFIRVYGAAHRTEMHASVSTELACAHESPVCHKAAGTKDTLRPESTLAGTYPRFSVTDSIKRCFANLPPARLSPIYSWCCAPALPPGRAVISERDDLGYKGAPFDDSGLPFFPASITNHEGPCCTRILDCCSLRVRLFGPA